MLFLDIIERMDFPISSNSIVFIFFCYKTTKWGKTTSEKLKIMPKNDIFILLRLMYISKQQRFIITLKNRHFLTATNGVI